MNKGKYVFTQISNFLPRRSFDRIVEKYNGNRYVKHFTCWNQLLAMIFGQLTSRDSLRDLILALDAHSTKSYHLGFGKNISRSNLSKANENRDYRIFEEFAYLLIDTARKKLINDDFKIKGKVYAFDSTTIDLCLNVFWWAKFRKTKGGIKLHTLYDLVTQIPAFVHITSAATHDTNAMDFIPYESGAYYIFDRGYVDFSRLYTITQLSSFFVIRAKKNMKFKSSEAMEVDESKGIMSDQKGEFRGHKAAKEYPGLIRRVVFYDKEMNRTFVFLSNNMELPAEDIALLYKNRWQVELFFKWIKQHLKVKSFWGETENAVRIQIYSALTAYCLVAIIGHDLQLGKSTYEILQVLGISLLDKTPVKELFSKIEHQEINERIGNQLSLSLF